jgi:Rad3-related DNA helicase
MSGGHFQYKQYELKYIADEIEQLIRYNGSDEVNEYGDKLFQSFSEEVIEEFKRGEKIIREALVYAQRIDWLVSADDGEKSFLSRLKEELTAIKSTLPTVNNQ